METCVSHEWHICIFEVLIAIQQKGHFNCAQTLLHNCWMRLTFYMSSKPHSTDAMSPLQDEKCVSRKTSSNFQEPQNHLSKTKAWKKHKHTRGKHLKDPIHTEDKIQEFRLKQSPDQTCLDWGPKSWKLRGTYRRCQNGDNIVCHLNILMLLLRVVKEWEHILAL